MQKPHTIDFPHHFTFWLLINRTFRRWTAINEHGVDGDTFATASFAILLWKTEIGKTETNVYLFHMFS